MTGFRRHKAWCSRQGAGNTHESAASPGACLRVTRICALAPPYATAVRSTREKEEKKIGNLVAVREYTNAALERIDKVLDYLLRQQRHSNYQENEG